MENPRQVALSPCPNPTLFLKLCGKPEHLHHISKCLYRLRTPEIEADFSHVRSLEKVSLGLKWYLYCAQRDEGPIYLYCVQRMATRAEELCTNYREENRG